MAKLNAFLRKFVSGGRIAVVLRREVIQFGDAGPGGDTAMDVDEV